jgi:PPP family 3-phenylpropionic acid transporter
MPYWRLAGFYFFYFAVLGVLVPYWGLYLKSIGFAASDIGNLMALLMGTRIVAPNVWAWIADHRRQRMRVVRLAAFLTIVAFAGVFGGAGYARLAVAMLLFSFFWYASLPLLEVLVMNHTAARPGQYGRIRLWGSIGFIVSVAALGPVVDRYGPWWTLPTMFVLMFGIWGFSLALPESQGHGPAPHPERFTRVIMKPDVLAFLLACFLMQVSHGPYYTFYTIYLNNHGYSNSLIGGLWAFAVVCEIGVFLAMPRILKRVPLRSVLLASFALAAARWLLIGWFPDYLGVLVFAQVLHAATFGTFHGAAIQMVYRFFTGRHQHRGQAIYSTASFGVGGALGSFYSGQTWVALGPAATYTIAAVAAAAAFVVAYLMLRSRT